MDRPGTGNAVTYKGITEKEKKRRRVMKTKMMDSFVSHHDVNWKVVYVLKSMR